MIFYATFYLGQRLRITTGLWADFDSHYECAIKSVKGLLLCLEIIRLEEL